ncbi:MAG: flavodoxin domain-containing protein [Verrucomicrobiota bacterium]
MKDRIAVLFASQLGNAEEIAGRAVDHFEEANLSAELFNLEEYQLDDLKDESKVIVVASTWGEGEPPDNACEFYDAVMAAEGSMLSNIHFAVFSLGDSSYEHFCKCGKDFDEQFEKLGAKRVLDRIDCDCDEQDQYPIWIEKITKVLLDLKAQTSKEAYA